MKYQLISVVKRKAVAACLVQYLSDHWNSVKFGFRKNEGVYTVGFFENAEEPQPNVTRLAFEDVAKHFLAGMTGEW